MIPEPTTNAEPHSQPVNADIRHGGATLPDCLDTWRQLEPPVEGALLVLIGQCVIHADLGGDTRRILA
jgi:hypothetical protein